MAQPGSLQLRCPAVHQCRGSYALRARLRPCRILPGLRVVAMVRNRGRLRDPDNSPLRDGNRDVLFGMLTKRAIRTLVYYLSETNQNMAQWLVNYFHKNPIPDRGRPQELSGDDFLRSLLCMGEQRLVNPYTQESLTIDPRSIAQRILDIRVHLAKEWQEDLKWVRDENADMLRESLLCSLKDSPQPEGKIDDDGRPI